VNTPNRPRLGDGSATGGRLTALEWAQAQQGKPYRAAPIPLTDACHYASHYGRLFADVPAVAVARLRSGRSVGLCQYHLDNWLDSADDEPMLEPLNLWWINEKEGAPTATDQDAVGGRSDHGQQKEPSGLVRTGAHQAQC